MKTLTLVSLLGLTLFSSCKVGYDYVPGSTNFGEFTNAAELGPEALEADDLLEWWKRYEDIGLVHALEYAWAANRDLRIAAARLEEALALRGISGSRLGPAVGASGSATRSRLSENSIFGNAFEASGVDLTQEVYTLGLDASWELDLFGGIRRGIEASDARVESLEADWRAVRLGLTSEIARLWIERAGTRQRIALLEEQVALQTRTLDLVRARVDSGLSRPLELDQAIAQLEATRSLLPNLDALHETLSNRLGVLIGKVPGKLDLPDGPLPSVPAKLGIAATTELVDRRPDVMAAERRLAAATADIGVATAELYPKFSLFGGASLESVSSGDLLSRSSRAWRLGPSIRWRLFESGRIESEIDGRRAAREAAVAAFEQTILIAMEEVENAAISYARERERRDTLELSTAAARSAATHAQALYDAGLETFLVVLDSERRRNEAERALLESEIAVRTRSVALFKALGGGWAPESEMNS